MQPILFFLKFIFVALEFLPDYDAASACENRKIVRTIRFLFIYFSLVALVFSSHYFLFPHSPIYMTSQIDRKFMHPAIYYFYGLITSSFTLCLCWTFATICSFLIIYYIHFVPIFALEFRLGPTRRQRSGEELRKLENFTKFYRSLEIIINFQNELSSVILAPMQTGMWLVNIFSFLALVWNGQTRMSWKREAAWGNGGGKGKRETAYLKKFRRSCRPLSICHGRFFVVKPVSVLGYLKKVTRGAFKALIMMHKSKSQ